MNNMKIFNKNSIITALAVFFVLGLNGPIVSFAAITPSLGAAVTYGVLSSTYTNTTAGTIINGDVGFTTPPATAPTGVYTNYGSGGPYATAGTDQGSTLSDLASQLCTFTFAPGAIDLAIDTTHGPIGIYTPGVYCVSGAASIGTAGITLNGAGTYIFRVDGALTSVDNSHVTLADASACDVFWTPTEATTLGANSTFVGINIDAAGITLGNNVTWIGEALAFGGTVTTAGDTITVSTCTIPPPVTTAILHVIKQVVNTGSSTAISSDFTLHVKNSGEDVSGSPAAGTTTPGRSYILPLGTYVVSEDANALYTPSFTGACDSSGSVSLLADDDKTCTIINTGILATSTPPIATSTPPTATSTPTSTPVVSVANVSRVGGSINSIRFVSPSLPVPMVLGTSTSNQASTVLASTPSFPYTGLPPQKKSSPWNIIIPFISLILFSISLVVILKKRTL